MGYIARQFPSNLQINTMQLLLSDLFNHIMAVLDSINIMKNLSLESKKIAEYDVCNQARIDFYKFRQNFLSKLTRLLEYEDCRDIDFSFIEDCDKDITKKLESLDNSESSGLIKVISDSLKEIQGSTTSFIAALPNLNKEEREQINHQIAVFQYSITY